MRNTHVLTLSLKPKSEKDTTPGKVHIMRHHIVAMVPNESGTTILLTGGVVYEVQEKADHIMNKCKSTGLMTEVM